MLVTTLDHAAGNDYLAAAVGFKHDTPADGILLPVALIVGAIVMIGARSTLKTAG